MSNAMPADPTLAHYRPAYYRHSGKVPPGAAAAGMLVAVVSGAVVGAVYGFLQLFTHEAPAKGMVLGMMLLLLGAGFSMGFLPVYVLKRGRVRSMPAALVVVLIGCLVAYYFSWVFFSIALDLHEGWGNPPWEYAYPDVLGSLIVGMEHDGLWSMLDWEPKGIWIVLFWIAEVGIIGGLALRTAWTRMNKDVFCEQCKQWGTRRELMQIKPESSEILSRELAQGHFEVLEAAERRKFSESTWCNVELEGCPTCDSLQALNVNDVTYTVDKKGKASTKTRKLVNRLLLEPEQTAQLALIAAKHAMAASEAEGTRVDKPIEAGLEAGSEEPAVPEAPAAQQNPPA